MACGNSGNLVFVAFSDNSLKMIDTRMPEKETGYLVRDLTGSHEDSLIKSLLVSPDESVVYSGGTDGLVSIWDVSQQQVIKTFGQDKSLRPESQKYTKFHSDSIWQIA